MRKGYHVSRSCSHRLTSSNRVCLCCGLQDRRFSDEIDKLTGYKTKSLLCMPIRNSDGETIGVAQAINKSSSGELFTEDDEKVSTLARVTAIHRARATLWRFITWWHLSFGLASPQTFAMLSGQEQCTLCPCVVLQIR